MDLWQKLAMELDSLKLTLQLTETQKMLSKDMQFIKTSKGAHRQLDSIAMFAKRAAEIVEELERQGEIGRQTRWNDPIATEGQEQARALSDTTSVRFPMFNVEVKGKVDTGATTSSLDATDLKMNQQQNTVSFKSSVLSQNIVTLHAQGAQEVHSADHGGETRPIVKMDIEIGGVLLKDMLFNLNDRSNMDAKLLIGQNVLKAGEFSVDINKGTERPEMHESTEQRQVRNLAEHANLAQAVELLRNKNVTFEELFCYLTTEALLKVESVEK